MSSLPRNELKAALAARQRLIGLWCNFTGAGTVEALAGAGFDWLLLEMEHAPNDLGTLHAQLMALKGSATHPIVRVPALDITTLKRVLDLGAISLMIPNVRNAAEARDAVAFTRYPPEGVRGVATSTRAGGYTRIKDYLHAPTTRLRSCCRSKAARLWPTWTRSAARPAWTQCSSGPRIWRRRWGFAARPAIRRCWPPSTRPSPWHTRPEERSASSTPMASCRPSSTRA